MCDAVHMECCPSALATDSFVLRFVAEILHLRLSYKQELSGIGLITPGIC